MNVLHTVDFLCCITRYITRPTETFCITNNTKCNKWNKLLIYGLETPLRESDVAIIWHRAVIICIFRVFSTVM